MKLRGRAQNLWLVFAVLRATYNVSLVEIDLVDAAECRPIIENFGQPLMF